MLDLPFVDLRAFSEEAKAFRLTRPAWPLPVIGHEFVRRFGVVQRHKGGGIMPWTGEDYFCDASRTIVFDKPLSVMAPDVRLIYRSRRLFTNGVVGRAELEFRSPRSLDFQKVAAAVASLNVRVGRGPAQRVIAAGGRIASEYAAATRPVAARENSSPPAPSLVVPGLPMVVIEYGVTASSEMSRMRTARAEVLMEHNWSYVGGSSTALWTISHRRSAQADEVRRARRHAVRLHCEIEAFAAVLRAIQTGRLDVEKSEALRQYLYINANRLLRDSFEGLPQAEVLRSIASVRRQEREGETLALEEAFQSVSPGFFRTLKDAAELISAASPSNRVNVNINYQGTQIMKNHKVDNSIVIGKNSDIRGNVGRNNTIKESSFGDAPEPEIVTLVAHMISQLSELRPLLQNDELELAEIVEEKVSKNPTAPGKVQGLLNSIVSGVKSVGEAGVPALETIKKIMDMLPA